MITETKGILEIDHQRGVIYFHVLDAMRKEDGKWNVARVGPGATLLRICQLPKPIPLETPLDITHMHGSNWDDVKVED